MANPNIVSVATINGVSLGWNLTNTLTTTPIYLKEGDILKGGASVISDLELFITYEVIAV